MKAILAPMTDIPERSALTRTLVSSTAASLPDEPRQKRQHDRSWRQPSGRHVCYPRQDKSHDAQ